MQKEFFDVRAQDSFQINPVDGNIATESSLCDSIILEHDSITQILEQLAREERRKHLHQTDPNMNQKQLSPNRKKTASENLQKDKQQYKLPRSILTILNTSKNSTPLGRNELEDRIYGAFFGFVIGDVVGAHLTHQAIDNSDELQPALLMERGGPLDLGSAQCTDQTQICFSAAYGLLQCGSTYDKNIVAKNYLQWLESKPHDLPTLFALPFTEIKKMKAAGMCNYATLGWKLREHSKKNIKHQSNLGLVRVLPLIIWGLNLSESEAIELIKAEMELIVPNQTVLETAIVYCKLLRTVIKTRDHELAFYEASKWIYQHGSERILSLLKTVQGGVLISAQRNMCKLEAPFTYTLGEVIKKQVTFIDSLLSILGKGGQTDSNCAIVMAIVGAVVGYEGIPPYFKQKIVNYNPENTPRPRQKKYWSSQVVQIVQHLINSSPHLISINNQL